MKKKACLAVGTVIFAGLLTGCQAAQKQLPGDRSQIEFTVVDERSLPEELARAIEEHKKGEIRMTYLDGEDLYLIRGYGEQKCGGYSISVAECSEDEDEIYFDTRLIGPSDRDQISKDPSYPYLVVKIEARDKTAVIQ